jgi:hypothetical protein
MFELIPYQWAVDQHVPLIYFLLALLTNPATWTRAALNVLKRRFSGIEAATDPRTMTEIKADISLNGTDDSNLLQRLGQLRDEIDTIQEHKKALAEMGYVLEISTTSSGELSVTITDKTNE